MRVLSIGTDTLVFDPRSTTRARQRAYAGGLGQLDIIVLAKNSHPDVRDATLFLHAAASASRFLRLVRAYTAARMLPKPDVVTVQDPFEVGLIGWLIARKYKAPLHVQVHTDFLSPEYVRLSLVNRARVWIAGFVLRRATRMRVVSERIKKSLEETYHLTAPISVLPIFTDIVRIRQTQPDSALVRAFERFDKKILFVGRLEPEKNSRLAVEAFAKAAPERTCLIVVGDGSERKTLEELAKKLGLVDGPRMVFFETKAESAKYYPPADLVLVTSHYEGYGLVTIEALAAGKPVLSTDVGIAREAGAIVTSSAKFAEALAEWFKNGPRSAELKNYPYKGFNDYVQAYCDDIKACVQKALK